MKNKALRSLIVLALLVGALTFAGLLTPIVPRGQTDPSSQAKVNQQKVDPASYPLTDFDTPEPTDAVKRGLQRARSRRYDIGDKNLKTEDLRKFALKETDPEELFRLIASHAPPEPAIPFRQSDAIAIGEVTSSQAHISNDKTNVYSEFQVRVEQVLKNDKFGLLSFGSVIPTTRQGGRVRFVSGKTLLRGSVGKNMPRSGGRYLFFLTYDEDGEDYPIITAYELRDARVFPLDRIDTDGKEGIGFASIPYENAEEADFIREVKAAIEREPSQSKTISSSINRLFSSS